MFVEWKDAFSVGIDELDTHHKKLLDLLNRSYFLILKESDQTEVLQLLDELIEYAQYHFATEETLMRQNHYQKIDQHLIEHFSFINKVLSFRQELNDGRRYLPIEIFEFIRNWLVDHIQKIDSEMGKALSGRAVPVNL